MTHDVVLRAGRRRRRRPWVALPILSGAILVVGWSMLWIVTQHQATRTMDAWFAAEDRHGRHWSCPDRDTSGFPLRIVVSCTGPSVEGKLGGGLASGQAGGISAETSLTQPNAVEVTLTGPLTLHRTDGAPDTVFSWTNLVVSVRIMIGAQGRVAVTLDGLDVAMQDGSRIHADHAELHAAPASGKPAEDRSYDVVAQLSGGLIPALDALTGDQQPLSVDERATISAIDVPALAPWPVLVEHWRTSGGAIDLAALDLVKGSLHIGAQGQLGLDEMHRASGQLQASLAGYEAFAHRLGLPLQAVSFGGALASLLGQTGGRAAEPAPGTLNLPVMLADGHVLVGPFKTSLRLPPLY